MTYGRFILMHIMKGVFGYRLTHKNVLFSFFFFLQTLIHLHTHTHKLHTQKHVQMKRKGGREILMRTYLFLSDSWRKNSVDVNERQLVLIKNEIAPLHAMQLYPNKRMINFCWYKTLLSTTKVPMQQRYNCSEAEEEEKH